MRAEQFFDGLGPAVMGAVSLTPLPLDAWERTAVELGRSSVWVHADLMDGVFTPSRGVCLEDVHFLARPDVGSVDVHVMVAEPGKLLDGVLALEPARVTLHVETIRDPARVARRIRDSGASPWVAINPTTDLSALDGALDHFDGVLVMLVRPGTLDAPDLALAARVRTLHTQAPVGVDGGVNATNRAVFVDAGASYLVVGRALLAGGTA